MKIFLTTAASFPRLLAQSDSWLRRAMPGHCAFCLANTQEAKPWCEACLLELPWNLPACERCAEPLPAGLVRQICGACLKEPPRFTRARVPLLYREQIAILVWQFKFSASPRAGTLLLELMEHALEELPSSRRPQALVSVPLHSKRARARGFNQADWLARRLAGRLDIPCIEARRLRATPSQRGLDRRKRRRNLRGAFVLEAPLPSRVALVDDVMTTGATLNALAEACLSAGAGEVEAWAIARTPME
ncbi:ComF family protein [Pistricoccus aurantiacus]|uniref:ComF family protein n=1 Tax=Pistricoccus aurantiacus TaxID=1883414 RepID=UPI0036443E6A